MCIDTCTLHTHIDVFVCVYIHTERKRETYKLLTAAYSCNSFCLMALLGFLIVMTNWLPSNAEMGKASWSYRRNMRTYLTMCKGTQGLFYFFFIFFFLWGKQERRLELKQCKSFGNIFKQKSFFVNVVQSKLLGWLLSVQRNFWETLSCPLWNKWQVSVLFPAPQQSISQCPLQYLAQIDATEDAFRWRSDFISRQYNSNGQKCSLSGKVLMIKLYLFWDCNHKYIQKPQLVLCSANLSTFKVMQQSQVCQWLWFYLQSHAPWYFSSKLWSCETLAVVWWAKALTCNISNMSHPLSLPHAPTSCQPFLGRAVVRLGILQPWQYQESHGARIAVAEAGAAIDSWQVENGETPATLLFPTSSAIMGKMIEMWAKLIQKPEESAFIHWCKIVADSPSSSLLLASASET